MNRANIVVVFSVLVMFMGLSHVISSHVAKDCGAHKPINPECPILSLSLSCSCSLCNNQSICLVLPLSVSYITKPLCPASIVQVNHREPVSDKRLLSWLQLVTEEERCWNSVWLVKHVRIMQTEKFAMVVLLFLNCRQKGYIHAWIATIKVMDVVVLSIQVSKLQYNIYNFYTNCK